MTACSSCGKGVDGADILYTAQGALVCAACFDKADLADTTTRATSNTSLVVAGLVVGLIPFFLFMRTTQNGVTRDWVAVTCGAIAALIGGVAAGGALRGPKHAGAIGLAAAVVALGALQLVRGFGLV